MPDFKQRSAGLEVMDDLNVSGRDLHQALHELESINYLLGGNYVTLNGLSQLLNKNDAAKLHVADLGCGSGDMLKLIRRLLEKRRINATLTGLDANPNVIKFAAANTPETCRIQYESLNIFSDEFRARKFDIVLGTLFFHHFTTQQLIAFFKQLKDQVSRGVIINDIHRHWFSYYSIKWLTKFFSRSPMVKHDAPMSVLRSFHKGELVEILNEAGIVRYRIKWRWAFRWQVIVWL
ncbi:MAG: methyltransferase domain-containing protein [Cyclobacteriaceae bacterium]